MLEPSKIGNSPNWKTLYEQEKSETLPWYYPELDPDLKDALSVHGLKRDEF